MAIPLACFGFEKNDQSVPSEWIPWFATNVWVEISVKFPENYPIEIDGFNLLLDNKRKVPGVFSQTEHEGNTIHGKIRFVFPNGMTNVEGKAVYRKKVFTTVSIPFVSQSQFIGGLSLASMGLQGIFGNKIMGCDSFSGFGSSGLMASFGLGSQYGFRFLEKISLQLKYSVDGKGHTFDLVPLIPETSQGEMPFSAPLSGLTKQVGNLEVDVLANGISVGKKCFKGINQLAFQKSLAVERKTFIAWRGDGSLYLTENVNPNSEVSRIAPVFILKTTVAGLVGVSDIKIYGYSHGSHEPFLVWQGKRPIGETPAFLGPVTMDFKNIKEVKKFEVWAGRIVLGALFTGNKPSGVFTSEGAIANMEDLEGVENVSVQEIFNKLKKFTSPN